MRPGFIAVVMLGLAAPAAGQIYRCDTPAGTVFSQVPCAPEAEKVEVEARPYDPTAAAEAELRAAQRAASFRESVDQARIDTRVRNLQRQILEAQSARGAALARIRARRSTAANNQAGATFLQSLAAEEQAVISRYGSQIEMLRAEIRELERSR